MIPPEDDEIGGIIKLNNKKKQILLIVPGNKTEHLAYDTSKYQVLIANDKITAERIYNLLDE